MSGLESNPEAPDDRDEGRPLSPEAADPGPAPPYAPTSAWARDLAPKASDQPEPDEDAEPEDEAPKPRPWAVLLDRLRAIRLPAISWPFGFPSLGSERHEVLPPLPHDPAPAGAEPARSSPVARWAARFPALAMKRETRIGLAAVVTFVFLVTGLLANRGLLGKFVTLAMESPREAGKEPAKADGSASPAAGKGREGEKPKPKAKEEKPDPSPHAAPPAPAVSKDKADLTLPEHKPPDADQSPPPGGGESAKGPESGLPAPQGPSSGGPDEVTLPPPSTPPAPMSPAGEDRLDLPAEKVKPPAKADAPPSDPLPGMPSMPGEDPSPSPPAGTTPASPSPSEPPIDLPPTPTEPAAPEHSAPAPAPAGTTPAPAPAPAPSHAPATAEPPLAPGPLAADPPPPAQPKEPSPAERTPALEQVPAFSPAPGSDPMAAAVSPGAAAVAGPGWVVIPKGGKRPPAGDLASGGGSAGPTVVSEPLRVPDGPAPADDPAVADQVEPVLHRVRSGENFFTISKDYYNSGRYYKALHAANVRQVPDIAGLVVGTVIRIPPPEALDRSLILPPGRGVTAAAAVAEAPAPADRSASRASRNSRPAEPADEIPVASSPRPRVVRADPEARDEPNLPTYRVKAHDTLRSIARDTLSDPHRYREILALNRDSIKDPNDPLQAGTTLTLPEDAIVGRRGR